MTTTAQAFDNRVTRKAAVLDTARPFVAVKPAGYLNPVIGHYATMKSARAAAAKFNATEGDHIARKEQRREVAQMRGQR